MYKTNEPISHLDSPPEFGDLEFSLEVSPVSLQAKSECRKNITSSIANAVAGTKYLLSGEVQIRIEWLLSEAERYESDSSPDIDNILKPMLDGLCGPERLLVDDCQLQAVDCCWIDWEGNQHVRFHVRFSPDDWLAKESLEFIHIGKNLYLPLHRNEPAECQLLLLKHWEQMTRLRDEIYALTANRGMARRVMPIQQPFHKTRLCKFVLREPEEVRVQLSKKDVQTTK